MSKIIFTIDVEPDLHTGGYRGVSEGLRKAEKLFDKFNVKPILFVTCDCIEKHKKIFLRLKNKGWEISLHGFRHERFDSLFKEEKEEQIKKAIRCFKKYLKIKPKGFRAPQHSIDSDTLDLLQKYGFEYDSSFTPLNLLQLLFFPKKFFLWFTNFFSPLNPYKIRKNLVEKPTSSFLLPFISLTFRTLPLPILKLYLLIIKTLYKEPIFYCHSWDFIELRNSRIDRIFSHDKFIKNLEYIIKNEQKNKKDFSLPRMQS